MPTTKNSMGMRMKIKRVELNMTQSQLATHAATSQSEISKIEKDSLNFTKDLRDRIANALGVTPCWLEFGKDEE